MTERPPKYFVAEESSNSAVAPASYRRLIDLFLDANGHTRAVVVTAAGALALADGDAPHELPPDVALDINHARLAGPLRTLRASTFHLFAMERFEPSADLPGVDDPLSLEGQLYGPFPSDAPRRWAGHLSTTRYDLLDALVRSARFAHYSRAGATDGAASRWLHLVISGDADGESLVLVYPLVRDALELGDSGNEQPVAELAHAILEAMRNDPSARGTPIGAAEVPAPSRAQIIERLEKLGYAIEGDVALRKRAGVLGRFFREEIPVPPHAGLDELLRVAREVLALVADRPTPRLRALNRRIVPPSVSWSAREPHGIRPLGSDSIATRVERGCLVVPRPKSAGRMTLSKAKRSELSRRSLYFDVDDAFADRERLELMLELVVFDDCAGTIQVDYDSQDNAYQSVPQAVELEGRGQKRKLELSLPLPRFRGRQELGGDFRLDIRVLGDLRIERLALRDTYTHAIARARTAEQFPAAAVEQEPVQRAVYFDDRYRASWVTQPGKLAQYLRGHGFAILDADQLRDHLRRKGDKRSSVVVMAMGVAPDTVLEYADHRALARTWLDAGGRMVWIGDVPFHHLGRRDGTIERSGGSDAGGVLDFETSGRDLSKPARLTADGRRWRMSLAHEDLGTHAVRIKDVSHALTAIGRDHASSWVKRFGPAGGTGGFIRYRSGVFDASDPADVLDLLRVTLHRLEPPPKRIGKVVENGAIEVAIDLELEFQTKGRTPIEVLIASERFRTTVASQSGLIALAVPAPVQHALHLKEDDEVELELRVDDERLIEAPADLQVALEKNSRAERAWDKLGRDWRRQIVGRLENAGAAKRKTELERVLAGLSK